MIWLVVFLLSRTFSGGSSSTQPAGDSSDLSAYTDSTASVYVDGPIVADQEHSAVRISVNKSESRIERLKGYDGEVVESRSYPKTTESYEIFLKALEQANFMKGDKGVSDDERGKCAGQNRYIFRLDNGASNVFRYWTTTCGGGTYGGSPEDTMWLFRNQIPENDYSDMADNIPMSL